MAKKPVTPYDDETGCVCARHNTITQQWSVLYDGEETGMSTVDGKWKMWCSEHGSVASETNKARATKALKFPETWCDNCKREAKLKLNNKQPMRKVLIAEQDFERLDREMRFWANKARNNPEKCEIFEKIYGTKPDKFWD